ncbi:hypothetical protein KL919_004799 [Ogataea angusta]|nr:hypothetical protein KL919_004799 [Ogataea angusta]
MTCIQVDLYDNLGLRQLQQDLRNFLPRTAPFVALQGLTKRNEFRFIVSATDRRAWKTQAQRFTAPTS